jgi:Asp-tRNA(Asn)/Glu-tRNA(Gln) amidotransferase A subunit family amidase
MSTTGQSEICRMSAGDIASHVNARRLSAEEVVLAHLEAIERSADLHAFITIAAEQALQRARLQPRGLLAGVPLVPKDMFDTAFIRSTRGSAVFKNRIPRTTASAVARLEAAGAVVLGKANQAEFAWGVTSQNPHWGDVKNPRRPTRTPGGSSGGNAAALAAGLCTLGLGTDTGGSIRIPSACCGTVGLKTSSGKIDSKGCFGLAPSFDTIGPMARSVADCALAYSVLTGEPVPAPQIRGLRVGVWQALPKADLDRWQDLGAEVVDVVLRKPEVDLSVVFQVEAALTHRRLFPAHRPEYGPNVRAKLDAAWQIPAVDYDSARRAIHRWRISIKSELNVDLLVGPTLGIDIPPVDVYEPDIRDGLTRYTRLFNWLTWPAIAVGNMQIGGPTEARILGAALAWEEAAGPMT